ncbi:MAG: hypothetical protein R3C45_13680 [Phycisphaerales bacterium]
MGRHRDGGGRCVGPEAMDITGDSDVSTLGTLVAAANPGRDPSISPSYAAVDTTINGVLFEAFPLAGNPTTHGIFTIYETEAELYGQVHSTLNVAPASNLSSAYQDLLVPVISTNANRTFTVTAASLNPGQTYLFQVWIQQSFGVPADHQTTITSGPSLNAVVLDENHLNDDGGLGQHAIATFTADSTSQTFTFTNTRGAPYVNGFQLRAVPEPTTFGVVMLCSAGLLGRWRAG